MTAQTFPVETTIPSSSNTKDTLIAGTLASNHSTEAPELTLSVQATTQRLLNSDIVQKAQADLARRLGLKIDEVQVLSVETQELPVQDLGCQALLPTLAKGRSASGGSPQPVAPGIVIGQVIRLEAGGKIFEYHIFGKRFVFCGNQPGSN